MVVVHPLLKRLLLLTTAVMVLSWLASVGLTRLMPISMTGEILPRAEAQILARLTLLILVPTTLFLYIPACMVLEGKLAGTSPRYWFAITCAGISVAPTSAVMLLSGGGGGELMSPTARLFLLHFGVTGAIFGYAYTWVADISG